jgi:hypothetical protein
VVKREPRVWERSRMYVGRSHAMVDEGAESGGKSGYQNGG